MKAKKHRPDRALMTAAELAELEAEEEEARKAAEAAAARDAERAAKGLGKVKPPISTGKRVLALIGVLIMILLTLAYTYSLATGAFLKW